MLDCGYGWKLKESTYYTVWPSCDEGVWLYKRDCKDRLLKGGGGGDLVYTSDHDCYQEVDYNPYILCDSTRHEMNPNFDPAVDVPHPKKYERWCSEQFDTSG